MFDRKPKSKPDSQSDRNPLRKANVKGGRPADAKTESTSDSSASGAQAGSSNTSTFNDHLIFEGKLAFSGTLMVNGIIRGSIHTEDTLKVGAKGKVEADIKAGMVEVAGHVTGNITAMKSVRLLSGAEVIGDIETPTVSMAEGVAFEGRCTRPAAPKSEPAPAPKKAEAPKQAEATKPVEPKKEESKPAESKKEETPSKEPAAS